MSNKQIQNLAKKAGKEKDAEKIWQQAVKIAEDEKGKKEKDFSDSDFAYTMGVFKNILGIKESKKIEEEDKKVRDEKENNHSFLESNLGAKEWLESQVESNKLDIKEATDKIDVIKIRQIMNQNLDMLGAIIKSFDKEIIYRVVADVLAAAVFTKDLETAQQYYSYELNKTGISIDQIDFNKIYNLYKKEQIIKETMASDSATSKGLPENPIKVKKKKDKKDEDDDWEEEKKKKDKK